MVRGVSSLRPDNSSNLLLSSMLKNSKNQTKKGLNKAMKHIDLPTKIALGTMGIYGTDTVIGDEKSDKTFLMRCSDYEGCSDFDYPPCNPYP